jgi:putative hydrolase of the HAD superfamily
MIKAFIFDLGNVLVSFDHSKIVERLKTVCDLEHEEIFGKAISSALVQDYNLGKISSEEFFAAVNRELSLRMNYEDFCETWNCTFHPEPIIPPELIENLSKKYKLLVLSDTNALHFDFIKENFPILDYFEEFILSHKVASAKPSSEIFQAAVKIAGCQPEECLFIDDLEANVEGARKTGINALQFVSAQELEAELKMRNLI